MHGPVLKSVYGSDIAVRLKRIHAHAERDGAKGWLVVALRGRKAAFVRGHFAGRNTLLLEVAPGSYPPVAGQTWCRPRAMEEALRAEGYWPDEQGCAVFKYEITSDSAVYGGAAAVILNPLISVFGARVTSKIDIIAPLAPERDEAAIQREMRGL